MKKLIILLISGICLMQFSLKAQTGDDGLSNRLIPAYGPNDEVARVSITLLPGFNTLTNPCHVHIDPNLQYNGGTEVTNGEFNMNYIRVYKPKADNATNIDPVHASLDYTKWVETISHFDGLGRLRQTNGVRSMPNGSDLIIPVKYDAFGRQEKNYLPYCLIQGGQDGPGGYRTDDITEQVDFNNYFFLDEGSYANSTSTFETSPLNRVVQDIGPGKDWQIPISKPMLKYYETNAANEICKFNVTASNDLEKDNCYAAGTLYKTRVIDENGCETSEYKDLGGHTIAKMSAVVENGDIVQYVTQYVYDDFGLLRFVLPPMASDIVTPLSGNATYTLQTDWIKNYCYYYEYNDGRRRMTTKKLPGCEPVFLVYNKRDKLVLTQDGNLRRSSACSFIKYDIFNRVVLTGIYDNLTDVSTPLSQTDMQAKVNTITKYFEIFSIPEFHHGYTSQSFPDQTYSFKVQTVTYYDSFDFLNVASNEGDYAFKASEMDFSFTASTKTLGAVTGSKTLVLGHDSIKYIWDYWLLTVNRYDKFNRLIQTNSDTHLGNKIITSFKYDYSGALLKKKGNLYVFNNRVPLIYRYDYDNGGRLVNTYLKISNNPEIILSQNVYNELGQAKQKKLHGSGSGFVQTEDFQYTIRGWLEKINDVHKPGNDLFAMGLNYTNGIVPQFNGNISAIDWVSSKFPEPNSYSYTYDQLNRLLTSTFAASGNFNESLTYDNNGNIATLVRAGQTATGVFGPVDDLAYIYTGNQLNNVNDNAGTAYQNNGFSDNGSNATNEYLYDPNGNLIKDLNKQIENITYTQHNLPQRIDMVTAGQPQILYLYDATGRKLLKQTRLDHDEVSRTDYDGSFVYKSGVLDYVLTPEGRAVYKGGIYNYEYNLKDHLGNTRVVFDQKGTVLQDNSYYPFGMTIEGLAFTSTEQNTPNKYLYNGKELQDDFYLDWYDYGARFYDPVLGRWHSVDPLAEKYNSISPFAYCALNPIKFVDKDGCEIWLSYVHKVDGQTVNVQYKNGALFNADGSKYEGKNSFFTRTAIQLNQLQYVGEETKNIITTLEQSDNLHTITNIDPAYPDAEGNHNRSVNILDDGIIKGITESENTVTKYDPEATKNVNGEKRNPKVGLIHELKHAFDRDQGTLRRGKTENGIKNSEVDAVNIENLTRKKTGDPKRTTYGRKQIPKEELK